MIYWFTFCFRLCLVDQTKGSCKPTRTIPDNRQSVGKYSKRISKQKTIYSLKTRMRVLHVNGYNCFVFNILLTFVTNYETLKLHTQYFLSLFIDFYGK